MSALTIGRFGLSPAADVDVTSLQTAGNRLTIAGLVHRDPDDTDWPTTVAVLRGQLVGLLDAGGLEAYVPVTWDEDDTLDGYYRPLSADVSHDFTGGAAFQWTAELERVPGFADPWISTRANIALVANDHSLIPITTTGLSTAMASMPSTASTLDPDVTTYLTTGEDGQVYRIPRTFALSVERTKIADYRYTCRPAHFYRGSCRVESKWGLVWWPLVGAQNRRQNNLRVYNGLVRAEFGSGGTISAEWFNGTTWDTAKTLVFGTDGNTWTSVAYAGSYVLRNTPETVVIRSVHKASNGGTTYIDAMIRKGSRVVTLTLGKVDTALNGLASTWQAKLNVPEAQTSINAGATRATSSDADGNRVVLMCPHTHSRNTTIGSMSTTSSSKVARFGIGIELDSSTAVYPDTAAQQMSDFYVHLAQRLTAVGR